MTIQSQFVIDGTNAMGYKEEIGRTTAGSALQITGCRIKSGMTGVLRQHKTASPAARQHRASSLPEAEYALNPTKRTHFGLGWHPQTCLRVVASRSITAKINPPEWGESAPAGPVKKEMKYFLSQRVLAKPPFASLRTFGPSFHSGPSAGVSTYKSNFDLVVGVTAHHAQHRQIIRQHRQVFVPL